ncbi:phosphonate ABC transporter ATP-binding protein [Allohahella marinimesophila]|uniref:Phosphonate ABC transporter ATP-binding protein n=1 Tax=Allohahella marinimesophila TaxID=1054972 RepID=A0ABP7P130_9GAMM
MLPLTRTLPADAFCSSSRQSRTSAAVKVEALCKRYDTNTPNIFSDVSFSIGTGESVAIIGPNGAGKSTLLKCCVRLLDPDSGSVFFNDQCLTTMTARDLRRFRSRIGFVFQKHQLISGLSALSNVLHGSLAGRPGPRGWTRHLAGRQTCEQAMHCLELVGLSEVAQRPVGRLSGGQSQRVAIARALMQSPALLIADEPTASLDPQASEALMGLLRDLSTKSGITLLFVSHELRHATDYADRVLGLSGGTLQLDRASSSLCLNELQDFFTLEKYRVAS